MPASLSRQFAKWAYELKYQDLPPEVVDKVKALTLQALASVLIGYQTPAAKQAIRMVKAEETVARGGSTILVDGAKVTKAGAGFANTSLISAGGKLDSYWMLTHPGETIISASLLGAEAEGHSGKDFITAAAAGYEVMERMARGFIPSVMARGFHAGPAFGIFGAVVPAAKLLGLDEEQIHSAIALSTALAAGNLEGPRSGGTMLRENASTRNAILAVLSAKEGVKGGDTTLEGDAGFYHSHTGNNKGKLSYVFTGRKTTSLDRITSDLGREWEMMNTLHRIYSAGAFNLPHIDVTAKLCADNNVKPEDVERVEAVVNWLETQYPSPAFPTPGRSGPIVGSIHYYSAYGIVTRGYPMLGRPGADTDPPEVLEMMKRIQIIPSKTQPHLRPKITIYTKNGKSYTAVATGREFMFDLKEESRRIKGVVPGLPIPAKQFDEIVGACSGLDQLPKADKLIQLTLVK